MTPFAIPKTPGLVFLSEEDGKPCHKHVLNGEEVPGCTSVSGLFQDDGWKFNWPPKIMYETAMETFRGRLRTAPVNNDHPYWDVALTLTIREIDDILQKSKGAWRRKRDKSADTGTIAHSLIEGYIKTGVVPAIPEAGEVHNAVMEFFEWERKFKPEWLASEIQVGSVKYKFAGILDALVRIDGRIVLLDFKTSGGIKDEYAIQLAGLELCLAELGLRVDVRAILHIPKEGQYEYREVLGNLAQDKLAFLVALEFYRHKNMFNARCKRDKRRNIAGNS